MILNSNGSPKEVSDDACEPTCKLRIQSAADETDESLNGMVKAQSLRDLTSRFERMGSTSGHIENSLQGYHPCSFLWLSG